MLMNKHRVAVSGVAALALVAVLAGSSAYAFSERGRSGDHGAEVALERRADPGDQAHGANNLQEQEQESESPVDMGAIIGEAFGADPAEVMALHAQGIGFGAIFKLYAIAAAKGTTVDALLATIPADPVSGERDFAFGRLKKSLSDAETAALRDAPKNLGQIVSASRRAQHAPETP